jgi:uncharacterized protein (DUF2147 family)
MKMIKRLLLPALLASLVYILEGFTFPLSKNPRGIDDGAKRGLLGTWVTEKKDLTVEVYELNGQFFGRMTDFVCTCTPKKEMKDHIDDKNPDPKLRTRPWLNAVVVYGLVYQGNNKWDDGFIYDLNSGKTYFASAKLTGNKLEVRGYWVFEFLGQSLYFYKG